MPLTAYSKSFPGELDVDQALNRHAMRVGEAYDPTAPIPNHWRNFLRDDLECPGCFVSGAEIVKSEVRRGKAGRQAFFRFTTPGHGEICDYGTPETANATPANLVNFTDARSKLTRAVRDMVCTAITIGIFDQSTIRDMRKWFYETKVRSQFKVTLDPRLVQWQHDLQNLPGHDRSLSVVVPLTREIAALLLFPWKEYAGRIVLARYPEHQDNMKAVLNLDAGCLAANRVRASKLAERYQGQLMFDSTALAQEHRKAVDLANFIAHQHPDLPTPTARDDASSAAVLAFAAVLLFVRGWNMARATSDFATILMARGSAPQDLGNVMGLNPFHDHAAWATLKELQELNLAVPEDTDVLAQRDAVEADLRARHGALPKVARADFS